MPNILGHERDCMIYLDNAATSWPKPENVYQTMDKFLRKKYMGLCSMGSAKVTRMMRLFPSRVTR